MTDPTQSYEYDPSPARSDCGVSDQRPGFPSYHEATRRFQRQFLMDVLERTGWDITSTARGLRLARSHVYRLMRYFDLHRPDGQS